MIIVKLISGLGNQLFQYAVGRKLSLCRKVPLGLDISFYQTQTLRSFSLSYFNIQADIVPEDSVAGFLNYRTGNSFYSKISRKIEDYLPKYKRKYYKEDEWWVYEPLIDKCRSPLYLEGYWQSYKYLMDLSPLILNELTIKQQFIHEVETVSSEIQGETSSVSIHVRRSDYITDPDANALMGVLPLEYYKQAIKVIKDKVKNPVFYFFSDDLEWVKDHIDPNAPSMFIETGKDYLDFFLMTKCRHQVIANSSFSWWGALLNSNSGKIVISPRRWLADYQLSERVELQFPNWIKI